MAPRFCAATLCPIARLAPRRQRESAYLAVTPTRIGRRHPTQNQADPSATGDLPSDQSRRRPNPVDGRDVPLGHLPPRHPPKSADDPPRESAKAHGGGGIGRSKSTAGHAGSVPVNEASYKDRSEGEFKPASQPTFAVPECVLRISCVYNSVIID